MVEDVGGRPDGDFGSDVILGVSSSDVSASDLEEADIGALLFGKASSLEDVFAMSWSFFICDILLCESIWFEQ